ncbi:condensation domain-containing protein, partial [Xylanibacillus composti]
MNMLNFLEELRSRGIALRRTGDAIKVQGKKEALTPDLLAQLREAKSELLEFLHEKAEETEVEDFACVPAPEALYDPFPLGDLQLGFYMADDPYMEFHVRPHYYSEKDREELDIVRYENAWNKALARHSKEIAIVLPDGNLQTATDPEPIRCRISDLRGYTEQAVNSALEQTRMTMERSVLPLDKWPWLDLRITIWQDKGRDRFRIHYNHNNFFWDGYGTNRLLEEVEAYYRNPDLTMPGIALSYRDAVLALDKLAASPRGQAARRYWEERIPRLPGPPELPVRSGMERRCRSALNRRETLLPAHIWRSFKEQAQMIGVTPSNAMFALYAEVLSAWSNSRHFVLSNMMTRRLDFHPDIWEIAGNFASLYPLEIDFRPSDRFLDRARRVQEQVIRDARHREWGGMQVMQAFNRDRGGFGQAPIPFVVGSGLFMEGYKRPDYSCLETSQVMLDHQFWELDDGRLYYVWDLLEAFFPAGMIDDMEQAYAKLIARMATEPALWEAEVLPLIPKHHLAARLSADQSADAVKSEEASAVRLEQFLAQVPPDRPALLTANGPLAYRELQQSS